MPPPPLTPSLLYNLLLLAASPVLLPWLVASNLLVKRRREGVVQRLGLVPRGEGRTVWVHAVSVGETKAAAPLVRELRRRLGGGTRILLSSVTATGRETARRECPEADGILFFPLDLPFSVSLALDRVRPSLVVLLETELWPNFLMACARRRIPVAVVNGRISDRSFRRYRALRFFFAPLLGTVERFLMQSGEDATRIVAMGADPGRVTVAGNLKYDRTPHLPPLPASLTAWKGDRFLLTAGSTHRGEEEAVLGVLADGGGDLRLALVPRHPQRFDEVAALLEREGLPYTRFSRVAEGATPAGQVLLVDAMGLLESFYRLADAAFVGGSLVPVGGHNLLEAAAQGVPVLTGPRTENFREMTATLAAGGGVRVVPDAVGLAGAVRELAGDPEARRAMGRAAAGSASLVSGAAARSAEALLPYLGAG
jgi:3-deoxy-D-manno-octulosonic-acid transferase